MLQLTAQMRIWVAVSPADFRCGIDGLAQVCRQALGADPFSGSVFVFRNRRSTAIKVLVFDGRGFWLCHKRLSSGRLRFWPRSATDAACPLEAHELQVLLCGGDPYGTEAAPAWRAVNAGG